MSKPLMYKREDFKILKGDATGDRNITYRFISKDEKVTANFFFVPGSVETRGIVWEEEDTAGVFQLKYPLLNPEGEYRDPPKAEAVLDSVILRLKRGEYE